METNCQYKFCKKLTLHSRIYKINNRNEDQAEHMEGPLAYNGSEAVLLDNVNSS